MNQVSEQFKQVNQASVEVFASVAGTAFSVFERLAALNLSTARGMLAQRQHRSLSLLAVRDPQTLLSVQAEAWLEDSQQAMDYSQRAIAISSQTRDSLTRLIGYPLPGRFPAQ